MQATLESAPTAWRAPLTRMVAVLGHELRNPLGAAVAGLYAASEMTEDSDPRSPFLSRALRDLGRVTDLLNRYLEFVRSGSLRRERLDLGDLVRELAPRFEKVVRVQGGRGQLVDVDPGLLSRALENLIGNAFEAGATCVDVDIDHDGTRSVVDVRDDGPGIAPEISDRMFEPFVSGRGSDGVGLALVADVVEAHGGSTEVIPSGSGTCFRVTLP